MASTALLSLFTYLIPNLPNLSPKSSLNNIKDPDPSIDSNLRQKSGTYENVVNRLVGDGAGDLLLEDEGRGDGVGGL